MTSNSNYIGSGGDENKVSLRDLGYNQAIEDYSTEANFSSFGIGRVILEHKERYVVKTENGDYEAEVVGNLRFSAQSRLDYPAVGDWVAISEYDDTKVLIHAVYPRNTIIKRKAIGKYGEQQIIATNINYAFVMQAVNRDFNLNRIERYLTICQDSGVKPIIVISKIDLIDEELLAEILNSVHRRVKDVPVIAISNENGEGIGKLQDWLIPGSTYCVLGSSGVGKSTLINTISGNTRLKTGFIGAGTDRGKHVTSHRELIVLESGSIIIDTPGMREIGITEMGEGLARTFDSISQLAMECRFTDCTHVHEKGCAVLRALADGEIDSDLYENYLKLVREKEHFESTVAEKRKKGKDLAKLIKTVKKNKKNKF